MYSRRVKGAIRLHLRNSWKGKRRLRLYPCLSASIPRMLSDGKRNIRINKNLVFKLSEIHHPSSTPPTTAVVLPLISQGPAVTRPSDTRFPMDTTMRAFLPSCITPPFLPSRGGGRGRKREGLRRGWGPRRLLWLQWYVMNQILTVILMNIMQTTLGNGNILTNN